MLPLFPSVGVGSVSHSVTSTAKRGISVICRYLISLDCISLSTHRSHVVQAFAAGSMCWDVYDPLRKIYNSILPCSSTPTPPLEEWRGVRSICEVPFGRYRDANRVGFA